MKPAMLRGVLAAGMGLLLAAALPSLGATRQRTGPDSFLRYRAYTVEDFMAQVESDGVLRQRLVKHFHMPEAELVPYLRSQLRIVTVPDSGWKPVYGVTGVGRIYRSRAYIRGGAKAFGLPDGSAAFRLPCGNPLSTELPPIKREKRVEAPPVWPKPIEQAVAAPVEAPPAPFEPVVAGPTQTPEEYLLLADIPRAPIFEVPVTVERSRYFTPFWWHSGHDHHRAVPEPMSVLLFGAGLAALGGRFVRRRRQR